MDDEVLLSSKKTAEVKTYLCDEEKEDLTRIAREQGLTLGELVRSVITTYLHREMYKRSILQRNGKG